MEFCLRDPKVWLILIVLLPISACDFFLAFRENQEVVDFLNRSVNVWQAEEKLIFDQFNHLIAGEEFSSRIMWDELEKNLIPMALRLREEVNKAEPQKEKLLKIKRLFLEKLDLLLEGFDLLREGLKKEQDKDSIKIIYQGRDKLKDVYRYNERIENEVAGLKKEYYIQDEKK